MAEMKLTYFNTRGRAEMARLLFKLAGKPFIDNRIGGEDWTNFKPSTPKGQLPVLEIDGKMICESMAICRYIARETGTYGENNMDAAACDMVLDTVSQVFHTLVDLVFWAKTEEAKADVHKKIDSLLEATEKLAASLKKGKFMLGDKASIADAAIYSVAESLRLIKPDFESGTYTTLVEVEKNFAEIPEIADWIKNRPETAH